MEGHCFNCDAALTGPFCAQCGQRHLARLSVRDWLAESIAAFGDVDSAGLRTVVDLTRRPGMAARDYVQGHRIRYLSPVRYALIACGFLLAALALTKAGASVQLHGRLGIQIGSLVAAPLIAIPVWLLFTGSGRSYTDQLVLQLYLRGHSLLAFAAIACITWLTGGQFFSPLLLTLVVVLIAWQALALWQFHRDTIRSLALRIVVGLVLAELASAGAMAVATRVLAGVG